MLPVISNTKVREAGGHVCVEYGTTRSTSSLCWWDDGNQSTRNRQTQKAACSITAIMKRGLQEGLCAVIEDRQFEPASNGNTVTCKLVCHLVV